MKKRATRRNAGSKAAAGSKGDRSRQAIKQAIVRLASAGAVEEISLSDICTATGLTTGAVYFHFGSRDDAVEEAIIDEVRESYRHVQAALARATGLREMLETIVRSKAEFHRRTKRLTTAIVVTINSRPRAYQAWLDGRTPILDKLIATLSELRLRAGLSVEPAGFIAHFLLGAIEDLAMDVYQWRNPRLVAYASDDNVWINYQVDMWVAAAMAPIGGTAAATTTASRKPARRAAGSR